MMINLKTLFEDGFILVYIPKLYYTDVRGKSNGNAADGSVNWYGYFEKEFGAHYKVLCYMDPKNYNTAQIN